MRQRSSSVSSSVHMCRLLTDTERANQSCELNIRYQSFFWQICFHQAFLCINSVSQKTNDKCTNFSHNISNAVFFDALWKTRLTSAVKKGLVPANLRPLYNLSRSLINQSKWEHLCGFVEPVESEHSSCFKAVICTFSHVQNNSTEH